MNQQRPKQLVIRISEEEKILFKGSADFAGINLTAWIRERLRTAAVAELTAQRLAGHIPGRIGKVS